jgi:hypothetical protein
MGFHCIVLDWGSHSGDNEDLGSHSGDNEDWGSHSGDNEVQDVIGCNIVKVL